MKRGRPKLKRSEKLRRVIHTRLTEAEYRKIEKLAKSCNQTVSECLRSWAMSACG